MNTRGINGGLEGTVSCASVNHVIPVPFA